MFETIDQLADHVENQRMTILNGAVKTSKMLSGAGIRSMWEAAPKTRPVQIGWLCYQYGPPEEIAARMAEGRMTPIYLDVKIEWFDPHGRGIEPPAEQVRWKNANLGVSWTSLAGHEGDTIAIEIGLGGKAKIPPASIGRLIARLNGQTGMMPKPGDQIGGKVLSGDDADELAWLWSPGLVMTKFDAWRGDGPVPICWLQVVNEEARLYRLYFCWFGRDGEPLEPTAEQVFDARYVWPADPT